MARKLQTEWVGYAPLPNYLRFISSLIGWVEGDEMVVAARPGISLVGIYQPAITIAGTIQ